MFLIFIPTIAIGQVVDSTNIDTIYNIEQLQKDKQEIKKKAIGNGLIIEEIKILLEKANKKDNFSCIDPVRIKEDEINEFIN